MVRPNPFARVAAPIAVVGLLLAPTATRAQELRVLIPADGSAFRNDRAFLVLEASAATRLLLDAGGKPEPLAAIQVGSGPPEVLHAWLALPEGETRFRLLDASSEAQLAQLSLTRLPLLGGTAQLHAFHTPEQEAPCTACHDLPPEIEVENGSSASPAGRACDGCHRNMGQPAYLHGPTAVYACFTCHDPDARPARFALRADQPALCQECHSDLIAEVMGGNRFAHGPVAVGQCTVCHSPHGGVTSTLLRVEVPDLCLRCHRRSLPAPVSQGLHGKVPCTACHDPHGGDTPILTATAGNRFCVRCHDGIDPDRPGHPILGHPVQADADPSDPSKPLGCRSCHPPHGRRDVSQSNFAENASVQRRFCTRCHG